jgi:hypothetical protein
MTKASTTARFAVKQKTYYGEKRYHVTDLSNGLELWHGFHKKDESVLYAEECNRDPKIAPGVKVRLVGDVHNFGASLREDLAHIVSGNRYHAGDEGVLAFPHPNQQPDGCRGWWYVEVAPKDPVGPRYEGDVEVIDKLYVGVWPGGFEAIE